MSAVAFLIDECVPASYLHGLQTRAPYIQAQQVGGPGMPPKRTTDANLLVYCEERELAIVSNDHRTLPGHALNHMRIGRHTWGLFILRDGFPFDALLDEMLLIHGASAAEDWIDQIEYLPF
jgi:hypothetical protein